MRCRCDEGRQSGPEARRDATKSGRGAAARRSPDGKRGSAIAAREIVLDRCAAGAPAGPSS
jgi:hypothetical protein